MIKTKEWLIENRKAAGLTQQELAQRTGLNVGSIQNIEQGKRAGSDKTWDKIYEVISNAKNDDNFILNSDQKNDDNFVLNSDQKNNLYQHGCDISKKLSQSTIKIWSKKLLDAAKTNNFDDFMQAYISVLIETKVIACDEIMYVIHNKTNIKAAAEAITLGLAQKGGKNNE